MKKVNTATNFKNSQANLKNGFKKKKPLKNKEGKAQKKSYSTNIYIYMKTFYYQISYLYYL